MSELINFSDFEYEVFCTALSDGDHDTIQAIAWNRWKIPFNQTWKSLFQAFAIGASIHVVIALKNTGNWNTFLKMATTREEKNILLQGVTKCDSIDLLHETLKIFGMCLFGDTKPSIIKKRIGMDNQTLCIVLRTAIMYAPNVFDLLILHGMLDYLTKRQQTYLLEIPYWEGDYNACIRLAEKGLFTLCSYLSAKKNDKRENIQEFQYKLDEYFGLHTESQDQQLNDIIQEWNECGYLMMSENDEKSIIDNNDTSYWWYE
jgi:hypothetical protein